METVQYHSKIIPSSRLRGNPVYTLRKAVDIWTHAIFLILLLCRRADTQMCDVSCRALKSPGSASEGGDGDLALVFVQGALWMSCAAGLCCTEGRVTLTNQTRLLLSLLLLDLICSILTNTDHVHMHHHHHQIQWRTCRGRVGSYRHQCYQENSTDTCLCNI